MPARLYDTMLDRILKWLMIMAEREGVGLNRLQLTTRISICRAPDVVSQVSLLTFVPACLLGGSQDRLT